MDIITNLKVDSGISEFFSSKLNGDIKGRCYENVYTTIEYLIEENKIGRNLEIAYGYVGAPNIRMTRHCFLVLDRNKIIDPTLPKVNKDVEYHIFKLLNVKEYRDLLVKFYKTRGMNEVPIMDGMIPEEKDYCDYVIKNHIAIEKDSYFEFLKQYDNYGEVKIFDEDLEAWLLFKNDTEGNVLTLEDVKLLKDGTELWIENKVPILAVKQGNILKNAGSGNLILKISDIGKVFIVKEYLGD